MNGTFSDHGTHEAVETRRAVNDLLEDLQYEAERDLTPLALLLDEPTESERQLEVWRETNSVDEVARDIAERTRSTAG
jgi:carboxylate-amine ligase